MKLKQTSLIIVCLFILMVLISCGKKPNELGIFSETYTNNMILLKVKNPPDKNGGYLGTWESDHNDKTIAVEDTEVYYEGTKSIKVTTGKGPWGGGMWFQFGYDDNEAPTKKSRNLSCFAKGSLIFWVKTTKNLLIKLESEKGGETQVVLSKYNVPLDNKWQKVKIPLSDFYAVNFKEITVVFGAHFTKPNIKTTFWVDNIYLTKEK